MILWASVLLIDGLGLEVYTQYPMMQSSSRQEFAQAKLFSVYSFPQFSFCLKRKGVAVA